MNPVEEFLFGDGNSRQIQSGSSPSRPAITTPESKADTQPMSAYKNTTTFLSLESVDKIPRANLLVLDEYAFNANELFEYMNSQFRNGNNIYLNPHISHGENRQFSSMAIEAIKRRSVEFHMLCASYEVNRSSQRIQNIPDQFFVLLETLLRELHRIGMQRRPFSFSDDDAGCQTAKIPLINYLSGLPEEQRTKINQFIISIPHHGGTYGISHTFEEAFTGKGGFECVIEQQIYLWRLLRMRKPEISVPNEIANHRQAEIRNLNAQPLNDNRPMIPLERQRQNVNPARSIRPDSPRYYFNFFRMQWHGGLMDQEQFAAIFSVIIMYTLNADPQELLSNNRQRFLQFAPPQARHEAEDENEEDRNSEDYYNTPD